MPELPVKEVRLPELHLPEIDREQIINSLSGLRLPAVDILRVERPRFGRQGRTGGFDWRAIDWRAIDLGPAIAGAGALVRLGSRARPLVRSRWAIAAGVVVVAGVAVAAIAAQPAVRERAGRTVRDVRARIDEARGGDHLAIDTDTDTDIEADVEAVAGEVVTAAKVAADAAGGDTREPSTEVTAG